LDDVDKEREEGRLLKEIQDKRLEEQKQMIRKEKDEYRKEKEAFVRERDLFSKQIEEVKLKRQQINLKIDEIQKTKKKMKEKECWLHEKEKSIYQKHSRQNSISGELGERFSKIERRELSLDERERRFLEREKHLAIERKITTEKQLRLDASRHRLQIQKMEFEEETAQQRGIKENVIHASPQLSIPKTLEKKEKQEFVVKLGKRDMSKSGLFGLSFFDDQKEDHSFPNQATENPKCPFGQPSCDFPNNSSFWRWAANSSM